MHPKNLLIIQRLEYISQALSRDPGIPTLTLAKRLFEKHGELFQSVEAARSAIRYHRGENGKEQRHLRKFDNEKRKINIPNSDVAPERTEAITLSLKGYGTIISDVHIPYHSKEAIAVALEHADKNDAMDWLFINGDFIDFYGVSKFSRNPKARRVKDELIMARDFLIELAKYYPRIIFKLGNHERRFISYLYTTAPEIADLPCLSLEELFALDEGKIEFIGAQQIAHCGDYLTIMHGHEFPQGIASPVNPARGAFLKAKNNCIVGHQHKVSEHVETDIRRTVISTFSLGCLCDLSPPYAPVNSYVHGFATMHMDGNDFEVNNYRITNNYKVR